MNCVCEYFCAYSKNVVFLKSRIRIGSSRTWIVSLGSTAAQTLSWEETVCDTSLDLETDASL